MKAYTDINQSKKLAEILPLESADMYYQYVLPKSDKIKHNPEIGNPINALEWYNKGYTTSGKEPITLDEYCVQCWSLAALVDILPEVINFDNDENDYAIEIIKEDGLYYLRYGNPFKDKIIEVEPQQNFVDSCVAMIEKLYEEKLL